jgi:DNA-binding transcriptional ArsR family regulator
MVVDNLTVTFTALSDPTRRAIIDRLLNGSASVNDLAEPFQVSQQAISKHLAYLERANLIKKHKDGRNHICALNAEPFREIDGWVNKYRDFWDGAIDRLDAFLDEIKSEKQAKKRKQNGKSKK